ncbi:NACHT domain-containing NTPase [Kutzneria sp. 744]|uniref:NACHT domain-containing protein n=1 Tax=Kutzneria sp. (strain 744) TaxID=345341 RepID=UPI0012FBCDC2|nr:NACHT domain-containing protein [Kutzneria sp. 744]
MVTGGVSGALFQVGAWILGFCVLGVGAALAYLERARPVSVPTASSTQIIRGVLAAAEAESTAHLEDRGVFEWHTMSLRWRRLDEQLDATGPAHPGSGIGAFFTGLESRRLVILGAPGAGKTVLAIQLVRQLIESWDESARTPFFVSMSSWNPAEVRLSDWLKQRLVISHPSLSAVDATGRRIADVLVDEHRVLPVLDGLDELGPSRRSVALAAIGRSAPFPFVLTCQTKEFATLTGATGAAFVPVLRDVVAVEIEPLEVADISAYMSAGQPTSSAGTLEKLLQDPRGVLAKVLSTPLMCFLTKVGYGDSPDSIAELRTLAEGSPVKLEEHLLRRFVPALFGGDARGPKPVRDWDARRAERWLSYLANNLVVHGERDLVPWRLYETLTNLGVLGIIFGGALSWCMLGGIIGSIGVVAEISIGLVADWLGISVDAVPLMSIPVVFALGGGAVAMLLTLHFARGWALQAGILSEKWRGAHYVLGSAVRFLVGVTGGTGMVVLLRLHGGPLSVALVAFGGGLVMGSVTWALTDWSREWRFGRTPRRIQMRMKNIPNAVVYGLGGGLVTALGSATLIGFAASALVAVPAVVVGVIINLLDERVDERRAESAASVIASDRWATALQIVSSGVVVGLFVQFVRPVEPANSLIFGLGLGVGSGLVLVVTAAVSGGIPALFPSTIWVRYLTAKWWLAAGGHVPIRLLAFLDDACTLGVMRKVGAVYQFRHVDLQRHLSSVAVSS